MNFTGSSWRPWRDHFAQQKDRPLPFLVAPYGLPRDWNEALKRSLSRFQVGEAGEGRIAREVEAVESAPIDADYRSAVAGFVEEQRRHAHILAEMVTKLGGTVLAETWTNVLFRIGRRLFGLDFKLLVLAVAEVIGIGFYTFVKDRLPSGTFRAALREVVLDKQAHLAFHTEYFRQRLRTPAHKASFLVLWWLVSLSACAVMYADQRPTWQAFRVRFFPSAKRLLSLINEAGAAIWNDEPIQPEAAVLSS